MSIKSLVLLLLALAAPPCTPAKSPEVKVAKELYYQGVYGDKTALAKSDVMFRELHQQTPNDALVSVYFGSLRLVEAERTWALWKKNSLSRQGIEWMDRAVKAAPDDLEIRFVRAATERHLPGFFGRKEQSVTEFRMIAQNARAAVKAGKLEPTLAAASLVYYGQICKEQSHSQEAIEAWKAAQTVAPASHAAQVAASELEKAQPSPE
jgi:hypothetical protein